MFSHRKSLRGPPGPGADMLSSAPSLGNLNLLEPHFPLENRQHRGPRVGGFKRCLVLGRPFKPPGGSWSSEASPLSSGAGYSHWFTFCPLRERNRRPREGQGHPQGPGHLQTPLPAASSSSTVATPTAESSGISHLTVSGKALSPGGNLGTGPGLLCSQDPGLSPSGADIAGWCKGLVPSLTQRP